MEPGMVRRKVLEKLADFPTGVVFDDLFTVSASFLPRGTSSQVLGFALFQLELEGHIVREDKDGAEHFKLTPDGFLKEALREQNQHT